MALERLAERLRVRFSRSSLGPWEEARAELGGTELRLVEPLTYMNRVGPAAVALLAGLDLAPASLIAIYDDLDIPFGSLRLRKQGGAAGHRGMLSLIESLGSERFPRLRLGLGGIPFTGDPADFVLEEFAREERPIVGDVIERAADALEVVAEKGFETAMNRFNGAGAAGAGGDSGDAF